MWFLRFSSIAAVLLGAGLASLPVRAQAPVSLPTAMQTPAPAMGESAGPAGDASASAASLASQPVVQRSSLWHAVEAERRRLPDASDSSPHRLSEAQRQELRDQIRRASSRDDGIVLSPVVARP